MAGHRYKQSRMPAIHPTTGALVPSAKLYFWVTGASSVALDTYSDAGLSSANTNPVVANSAGFFDTDIFLQSRVYRVELKDASDNLLWRADPEYSSRVRVYESALPSVNWPGLETVVSGTSNLSERNVADGAWNDRGNADTAINAASISETRAGTSTSKVVTPAGLYGVTGKGDNLTPSAGTLTIDSDGGLTFNVAAGNISAISSAVGGTTIRCIHGGATTYTHNGTSLICFGGADVTVEAGDVVEWTNEAARGATGSDWRMTDFHRDATTLAPVPNYAASQAEMETPSSALRWVTPAGLGHHPSVPKSFVKWDASSATPVVGVSRNVSSLSDTGLGLVGVNHTTAFSTADYVIGGIAQRNATNDDGCVSYDQGASITTTASPLATHASSTLFDSPNASAMFVGDQA